MVKFIENIDENGTNSYYCFNLTEEEKEEIETDLGIALELDDPQLPNPFVIMYNEDEDSQPKLMSVEDAVSLIGDCPEEWEE